MSAWLRSVRSIDNLIPSAQAGGVLSGVAVNSTPFSFLSILLQGFGVDILKFRIHKNFYLLLSFG